MKKIGRTYMMIRCPLCNFIYIANKGEYKFIDVKTEEAYIDSDNNFHNSIWESKILFHCPDCNRDIKSYDWHECMYTDERVDELVKEMRTK